jgi:hypothetical protein
MGKQVQAFPLDWEKTRCWARERLEVAGKTAAGVAVFLGLVGLVEYALYQMVQNWEMTGVAAAGFGYF